MTASSVVHASFTLERTYAVAPARVFAAFAEPAAKARWFSEGPEGWVTTESRMDFRVGGRETSVGGPPGGPVHAYEAEYRDIVPDERIVTTYEMTSDGRRISVSVATVELLSQGSGTRLVYTEQGAFLDDLDQPAWREQGMADLLDALGAELRPATSTR